MSIFKGKIIVHLRCLVYVIARVNFLFDQASDNFLSADIICDFFGTKKKTTGNKAAIIEKTLNIAIGDRDFCTSEIRESFSFVELPGGFLVSVKRANELLGKAIIDVASKEDSR